MFCRNIAISSVKFKQIRCNYVSHEDLCTIQAKPSILDLFCNSSNRLSRINADSAEPIPGVSWELHHNLFINVGYCLTFVSPTAITSQDTTGQGTRLFEMSTYVQGFGCGIRFSGHVQIEANGASGANGLKYICRLPTFSKDRKDECYS